MKNSEMMTLELTRLNVCDIKIALTSTICSMRRELQADETTECRKEILERSISKWQSLKDEIDRQFIEQDED